MNELYTTNGIVIIAYYDVHGYDVRLVACISDLYAYQYRFF